VASLGLDLPAELLDKEQGLRAAIRLLNEDIAYGTLNRLGCAETYTESIVSCLMDIFTFHICPIV
jgi:hypothetical protein